MWVVYIKTGKLRILAFLKCILYKSLQSPHSLLLISALNIYDFLKKVSLTMKNPNFFHIQILYFCFVLLFKGTTYIDQHFHEKVNIPELAEGKTFYR